LNTAGFQQDSQKQICTIRAGMELLKIIISILALLPHNFWTECACEI